MIGLLQSVTEARVTVGGARIAALRRGLCMLVGAERGSLTRNAGAMRVGQELRGQDHESC
jgi:D-Tyr-tRNAtyr deacylase